MDELTAETPSEIVTTKERILAILRSDLRHQYSIELYEEHQEDNLEKVLKSTFVDIGTKPSMELLFASTHLATDRVLTIVGILYGFPYLHDATKFQVSRIIIRNPVLRALLKRLNSTIVEIDSQLCLLLGSLEAVKYIKNNEHNPQCAIHMFFEVENQNRCTFTANPDHIAGLNNSIVNDVHEQSVFNLTHAPKLYATVKEAIKQSCHRFRVTINTDSNKVTNIASSNSTITTQLKELSQTSTIAHVISMMGSSEYQQEDRPTPFIKIDYQTEDEIECEIAYQCHSIRAGNIKVMEFTLHPITRDEFFKKTSPPTDDNITKIISLISHAMRDRAPIIIQLQPSSDEIRVMYAALHHLLNTPTMDTICVNNQQLCFEGTHLVPVKFSSPSLELKMAGTPYYGMIQNKQDALVCEALVEDINPLIAFTKSAKSQLPAALTPYVKIINDRTE